MRRSTRAQTPWPEAAKSIFRNIWYRQVRIKVPPLCPGTEHSSRTQSLFQPDSLIRGLKKATHRSVSHPASYSHRMQRVLGEEIRNHQYLLLLLLLPIYPSSQISYKAFYWLRAANCKCSHKITPLNQLKILCSQMWKAIASCIIFSLHVHYSTQSVKPPPLKETTILILRWNNTPWIVQMSHKTKGKHCSALFVLRWNENYLKVWWADLVCLCTSQTFQKREKRETPLFAKFFSSAIA